jgi:NDP-sugar pyrophosphorylase family protein
MTSRQAVILAGGLATRMRPRTLTVPKILLEVGGRPFVEWQLEILVKCNYQRVVMCIAHLGERVCAHVGDGARFGVHVDYADEGATLLGTGGALRNALALLDDTFLVTYGDSYLPFDYAAPLDALRAHDDCDAVMSVFKNEKKWDASNVELDARGERVVRYEKGGDDDALDYIDYGAIALRRSVVDAIPADRASGLDTVQTSLARAHRLRAYVARERFYEIGSPEGLAALEQRLNSHQEHTR